MPNKHTCLPPTDLLKARLEVLLKNVNLMYKSRNAIVEEDIANAYHLAMDTFLQSLDNSILYSVAKILMGSPADPFHYNVFTSSVLQDLEVVYSEVNALDRIVTGSFNSIVAEREQTLQVSRRISDKLGTYLLYADPSLGAGYFFGDSFNSPENIDVGSGLLDVEECFLGQNEGVVLLPLDGDPQQPTIKSYAINESSNGTAGNNFESGVVGHNLLEAIGDQEPNTWFEYERVLAYESSTSLILDLTISLEEIAVLNYIQINPMNFGTPTPVRILNLETSKDGLEYVSIKDEVPLKDFVAETEDNVFDLSSATAKFAGQGFYSFLPRKAQFVHIVLEQQTPYAIQTTNGTRLRYAIGLRDINILGRKFKVEGSLVSRRFSTGDEAKKIALFASENPTRASALADVKHSISENDGATWRALQPQHRSGFEIPEVIDYNTIAPAAITTVAPVTMLRHKIHMKREPKAFEGNVTLKEEKETQVDVLNIPGGGNFDITTTQRPIADTVRVILPFYGSFSCPTARYGSSVQGKSAPMDLDMLEFQVDQPASSASDSTDVIKFDLPFTNFKDLPEHIRVFHNGSQIEYCAQDEQALGIPVDYNSYTSYPEVDHKSKVYFLDKGGRKLQFGFIDSTGVRRGFLPAGGSKIQVCFDGDNPRLELTDEGYVLLLAASSDGLKENVNLVTMNFLSTDDALDHVVELPAGKDKIVVGPQLMDLSIIPGKGVPAGRWAYIGHPDFLVLSLANDMEEDEVTKELNLESQSIATETAEGMLPPVFVPDSDTWEVIEYDLDGGLIAPGSMILTEKKDFIDGRQELLTYTAPTWEENINAYSFDPYTGTVYTGSPPRSDRKTVFKCKIIPALKVPPAKWKYYRHPITGRIDSQKIILDPKYVTTHRKSRTIASYRTALTLTSAAPLKSIPLLGTQIKGHDWFNQKLVKGTVKIGLSVFAAGVKPVEVIFIDGESELYSLVQVQDELITLVNVSGNLYSYELGQITDNQILSGPPGFSGIRSETSPDAPVNYFETYVSGTPAATHQWTYTIDVNGNCLVTILLSGDDDPTALHAASYRYKVIDSGIDIAGLYSIDYTTGTLHFAEPTITDGDIQFEVSIYNAFYNIAEIVPDGDIKKIDTEANKITFSTSFGMRFLKLSTALRARPAYLKVAYEYYKQSTESLKDLEPYFSPIVRDIAIKAITSSTLEEL